MSSTPGSGGLTTTPEMLKILSRPGYISVPNGGQRLRDLYRKHSNTFNSVLLSPFGFACYCAEFSTVQRAVEYGSAPDLKGTETPYKFGYAAIIIAGAQRARTVDNQPLDHVSVLKYLISRGMPLDVEDIVGHTALHHASMNHRAPIELSRILLQSGASVNYQNRYGEVPLLSAFQNNEIPFIDLLMEFGADLDIEDADEVTPTSVYLQSGPQVTAATRRWIRKRKGEEAPMSEKKCDNCHKGEGVGSKKLMLCSSCQTARYCSADCQRSHWSKHKPLCRSFSASNTVTLKPCYPSGHSVIPTASLTRQAMGIPIDPVPESHKRGAHTPKNLAAGSKSIIIKVQIPIIQSSQVVPGPEPGALLVYTKKRDFVCVINRSDGRPGYDRIVDVVKAEGVGGTKGYFAAELHSKDKLVVKISQILAEQPF